MLLQGALNCLVHVETLHSECAVLSAQLQCAVLSVQLQCASSGRAWSVAAGHTISLKTNAQTRSPTAYSAYPYMHTHRRHCECRWQEHMHTSMQLDSNANSGPVKAIQSTGKPHVAKQDKERLIYACLCKLLLVSLVQRVTVCLLAPH